MDEIIIDMPVELLERIKAYLAGSKETVEEFIVRVLREKYQQEAPKDEWTALLP